MKGALLAFATALLRLVPARGFVSVSPGPTQRHQTAKHTHLPPTRRRERLVAPPTAIALASGAEAGLLSSPVFWSVTVMLTIVGLLKAWELSVEQLQETAPPAVRPVIDRVLGEIGGLGFVGLFLEVVLDPGLGFASALEHVSERYLDDGELLLEAFEFLHGFFFRVAVAFFAAAAFVITRVVGQINEITRLTESEITDGCPNTVETVPMAAYESYLRVDDPRRWRRLTEELALTKQERGAEILVIRERLKNEGLLPSDTSFRVADYLERAFAEGQLDLIKLTPLSWVPLIPIHYFAASIKFNMWLSVSSLVSFASQILLRDAAALSAGTAGALDRVPLEMGIFGLFCLLNIFELALVPTTFLNLGLIEVVEDFVERQERTTLD
jgi:hypothetical protein